MRTQTQKISDENTRLINQLKRELKAIRSEMKGLSK
jgi:hypothetical protein